MSFPRVLQEVKCPVKGCPAVVQSAGRLCKNFMYCHFLSKAVLVQDRARQLTRCDLCIMHMPAGQIIRIRRMARCDKNTQMRWWRRDVAIASRCLDARFRLTGEEEMEHTEGVEVFKYLGRMLDR